MKELEVFAQYKNKKTGAIINARRWNDKMVGIDDGSYPEGYLYNDEFILQYEPLDKEKLIASSKND